MGGNEWTEVRRKNGSKPVNNMGKFRSKEDDVARISTSVYIANLPDSVLAKDLFKACSQYGHVVDSFIPFKRDKNGKRFGFVRFINVFNPERLVNNLCTIWIDRYKIQANIARFQRTPGNVVKNVSRFERPINQPSCVKPSYGPVLKAPSFASAVKGDSPSISAPTPISTAPALVIDDAFVVQRDLENFVLGEVKQLSSIVNIRSLLSSEGFNNVKPTYMGGLWVMLELESSDVKTKFLKHVGIASWFTSLCNAQSDFVSRERIAWVDIEGVPLHAWSRATFEKIGSKWGEVMDLEECNDDLFARKRICIKTKQEVNILETFKIIVKRKVFVVRAKELFIWSPVLKDAENVVYCSDTESEDEDVVAKDGNKDENVILDAESDVEGVVETDFGDPKDGLDTDQAESVKNMEYSSDPFNIYPILNKQKTDHPHPNEDSSPTHPPGFTPERADHVLGDQEIRMPENTSPQNHSVGLNSKIMQDASHSDDTGVLDGKFKVKELHTGGSILEVLDDMIKVGQAMGFSMGGCLKDMEGIISSRGGHEGDR